MLDKLKAAALWVWNWITVLVAIIMGLFTVAADYLDQLVGVDLTQIMTQRHAAQITLWTALIKATVATYNAKRAKV
jgi:hypothetical protein